MSSPENPLIRPPFLIPFDQVEPQHAQPAIQLLLAEARQDLETLALAPERGFQDFLAQLDRLGEPLMLADLLMRHLDSVVSSPEWTAAKHALLPELTQFYTDLNLHPGLWTALKQYAATEEAAQLDPVWARFLKLTIEEFKRQGAELDEAGQANLRALNTELAQLGSDYGRHILEATAAFELYVEAERLIGLPERVRAATRRDAEQRGQTGHRLTLHAPVFVPVMTYAQDRALRHTLWEAQNQVGQQAERDNRPLVTQILRLRREKAQLLGYQDYADYMLENRMAKNGQTALGFIQTLAEQTHEAFAQENAELEAFYREQAGPEAPALELWDARYWVERQRRQKYLFDEEALRPYFPLEQVLTGLFTLTERLFGVKVQTAQAPTWHPEVQFYEIRDQAGTHLASFYTDWFPRDSKRAGAWMNHFITGKPTPDGFSPHLGLMCGNLTPPSGDTPALLSFTEVETVFHEFGHLLHHALSRVPVKSLAGTRVPRDFVELPSQIMENWLRYREVLDLFARHHQTGEPLPAELFERLLSTRQYQAATLAMRQYSFALTDLRLHMHHDPQSTLDPVAWSRELMQPFYAQTLPEDYGMVASFRHIFSGSYAAGYYSYKWSEVLDADAFSRFEREGLFNHTTGQAFLDSVLSRGNSAEVSELYRQFMGRDPDPQALLRREGLLKAGDSAQ